MTSSSDRSAEAPEAISSNLALKIVLTVSVTVVSIPVLSILWLLNAWGAFPRWGEAERRTLQFGEGPSLGELRLIQHANCFTCYEEDDFAGEAAGTVKVKVPDDRWHLSLIVDDAAIPHLSQLQQIQAGDLEAIDLAHSTVTDADLLSLRHFYLQELDLSGTDISGSGLQWLNGSSGGTQVSLHGAQKLNQEALMALGDRPGHFSLDLSGSNLDQPETVAQIREAWCPGVEPQSCAKQIR